MDDRDAIKLAQTSPLTLAQARIIIAKCQELGVDPFVAQAEAAKSNTALWDWVWLLSYAAGAFADPQPKRYPDAGKRR